MLTVYAPDLTPLGLIENYSSLQWIRRYSRTGQFELHLPFSELIKPENIIRKGDEAAVIESVRITNTLESGAAMEVLGRFLPAYLARRILWEPQTITDTPENVIRKIVTDNLRGLPLTVADPSVEGENIDYGSSYTNLLQEVQSISEFAGLGFEVGFDRVFRVYKGLDRTASQSTNPRAIFSREFENLDESEYLIDGLEYKNYALIGGGEKEGKKRMLATVGDTSGIYRREIFVNSNFDGMEQWEVKQTVTTTITQPKGSYIEVTKSSTYIDTTGKPYTGKTIVEYEPDSGQSGGETRRDYMDGEDLVFEFSNRKRVNTPQVAKIVTHQIRTSKLTGEVKNVSHTRNASGNEITAGVEKRTFTESVYVGDQRYEKMLKESGRTELANLKQTESFTATVNPFGNLRYKTDYNLGDIVTIVDMGFRTDVRITEINEIYENEGLRLGLTFGYERMMKLG